MRWLAYGAVALLAGLALTGAPGPDPRVTLDRAEARPGEQVLVRLTGWPAGTVVIELCDAGTPPRCAVDTSAQIHLSGSGAGGAPLTVAAPADGCPCQVRVRTMEGRLSATAPLRVTGATRQPGGTVRSAATRPPVVVGAHVERDGGWPALFGASARRTVVLRLRNDEPVPVAVTLSFSVGRGPEPTGFVASPDTPDLAAGEERVVRVPMTLPAPAVGDYRIHGELVTSGAARRVEATTDHQPWGLAGLFGFALLVPAAAEVRRRRSSGR
ncbi:MULTISPECIES: hypothetical protein [unclassified Micromonospora]|uniref:hypothetical protein n=1 Tax=unclassified Micromonospora TaxID=2617518 RepID=UPI001034E839|nr:hypothetical protein [Verrucosispora sp. SN26_14.1]TBL28955.1 hypothetical protein EYA84_25780 [Verrucosispora sp. SN26_14.1]